MPRGAPDPVVESHLGEHAAQIVDVHFGSKALAAAPAWSAFPRVPSFLVQFHTQLRGTLENMKELAERQIEQSGNNGDRMKNCQETVCRAAQPLLRDCER